MSANPLAPLRELTVLLAEDDDEVRVPLVRTLGLFFRQVLEAKDGHQAMTLFATQDIHLAILDITMPGPSGLEIAASIRERDADLPVLILTGHADPAFMRKALQLRLMDYLVKPVNLDALHTALSRCLVEMRARNRLLVRFPDEVSFNPITGVALVQGRPVQLTARERQFLNYLLHRRGKLVEAYQICLDMAPGEELSLDALRNLISRLRTKIGHSAVVSSRDLGYMIPAAEAPPAGPESAHQPCSRGV